jgi:hypothetical protein
VRIPKGRPKPLTEPGEHEHLSYRARALWWALTHRAKDRAPCRLAALYREMLARNPAKFYKQFEKYGDEEEQEDRPRATVAPWRYRRR